MDGRTRRTWERLPTSSELGLEHGDRGWKAMKEQNGIGTSNGGFDSPKKSEIFTPLPWVCYRKRLTCKHNLGLI
jgi:hypothetical protein